MVMTYRAEPVDPSAEEVYVRMRDGVRLATDVYLGGVSVPRPVVLVRLPYDKAGRYTFMPRLAPHFNDRGYVLVVQDVRGKFRSEGETFPYVPEVADGYDTLDWIVAQKWCDGVIGMFGDSYYGLTQWAAVASEHPALRAIVPRVTSADLLKVRGQTVPTVEAADYLAHYWVDNNIHDYRVDWSRRPLAEAFDDAYAAIGARSKSLDSLLAGNEAFLSAWRRHPFDTLAIPVLHNVGWFDNVMPHHMRDWTTLTGQARTRNLQYLVADSSDHENYRLPMAPVGPADDHDSNDAALDRLIPRYLGPALDFFDITLRGTGTLDTVPRARWHLGHEGWREDTSWPPPGARAISLCPGAGGRLAAEAGPRAVLNWVHDPDDMVPSTVTNPFAFLHSYPDESAVQERPDVLTFTSEPSDAPLDLAGPVSLLAHVGSTGPSMDVHVKLCDVAPDGTARMIVRGQARVTGPDPDRGVVIELGHAGYRLRPGHRLRIAVASSDFPGFLWHPGTSEHPWYATKSKRNTQTLVVGGASPTSLTCVVVTTG
jgi:putative CocE/NonD family hydrolase